MYLNVLPLWYNIIILTVIYSTVFVLFSVLYDVFLNPNTPSITWELFFENLKRVFTAQWNNEEVLSLKQAWREIILPLLPHRPFYCKIWELPLLGLFSFYTLIRTRFHLVQIMIIYRGIFIFLLFNDAKLLMWYSGPTLVLTFFACLPVFKQHFAKLYSPYLLKMLGWNTASKILLSQAVTGLKVVTVVAGVGIANEMGSPYVGAIRAERYAQSVYEANEHTISVNKVLVENGQPAGKLIPVDGTKYSSLVNETNVIREVLSGVKEVIPLF